jgi:hypothetical protein
MDSLYRTVTVPPPQLAAVVRAVAEAGWKAVAFTPVRGPDLGPIAAIQIVLRRSASDW